MLCTYTFSQSVIFYTASSIVDHGEAVAYLQQSMGGRRGTPWTGRQSIAGQHRHTQYKQPRTHSFTPKGNVERPGRNLEFPERSHACTGRTCKLHAERPRAGSRTQDLLAARQQCYQHVQYDLNHSVLEPGLPQKKGTFIPIYTTTETRTFSNHYTL
ncbi:hypothetical protein ATANTOWER_023448 [Ataeniobius toweri]|uniref:Uncharacterized protein n=1 Tax=Ataeniobius toweri TaxID=208326 RepID=A0ABU7A0Y6_9TELE|nr:hypothetical protein [Ataeniobius toweri]